MTQKRRAKVTPLHFILAVPTNEWFNHETVSLDVTRQTFVMRMLRLFPLCDRRRMHHGGRLEYKITVRQRQDAIDKIADKLKPKQKVARNALSEIDILTNRFLGIG